jgi:RNA polymerase sigma-70 factor, ECF subfamily
MHAPQPSAPVSRELLDACRRGDRAAQAELVRATQRRVLALAYRVVGDPHEAEDVAQESYVRIFRSLERFREESRFETWMYRIVTNTALNHLRSRGRFPALARDEDVPEVASPERFEDAATDRDELDRALAKLPPSQRIPLVLKDVYGLPVKDIARELGIEEGAVKVRLHRARRRMLELLAEGAGDDG